MLSEMKLKLDLVDIRTGEVIRSYFVFFKADSFVWEDLIHF